MQLHSKAYCFYRNKIRQAEGLLEHVRKAFGVSIICIVIDMTYRTIYSFADIHVLSMFVLGSAILLVQMICLIVCYSHWKHLLMPSKLKYVFFDFQVVSCSTFFWCKICSG